MLELTLDITGMDKTDKTALEAVLEVDDVVQELEQQADDLTEKLGDETLSEEEQAAIRYAIAICPR